MDQECTSPTCLAGTAGMDVRTTKPTATGTATELVPLWGVLGARLLVGSPQDALLGADRHHACSDHRAADGREGFPGASRGNRDCAAATLLGAQASLPGWGQGQRRSAWKSQELVEGNSTSAEQEE